MAGGSHSGGGPNIDLVPILDAMTAVIFFLVLSGTFVEYTKITVPPSATSVSTSTVSSPPLAPQMFGLIEGTRIKLVLKWGGDKPDLLSKTVLRQSLEYRNAELQAAANELVSEFRRRFVSEKSLQLGFSKNANYQEVISIIDGLQPILADIVLISSSDEKNFRSLGMTANQGQGN